MSTEKGLETAKKLLNVSQLAIRYGGRAHLLRRDKHVNSPTQIKADAFTEKVALLIDQENEDK